MVLSFEFLQAPWLIEMITSIRVLTLGFLPLETLLGSQVATVLMDVFPSLCSVQHINLFGGC